MRFIVAGSSKGSGYTSGRAKDSKNRILSFIKVWLITYIEFVASNKCIIDLRSKDSVKVRDYG